MIITLSWLKNHLATSANLEKIINILTGIGLEVEGIKEGQNELSDFIHSIKFNKKGLVIMYIIFFISQFFNVL